MTGPYPARSERPFTILTVCTANVCRSPLAAAVLTRELSSTGLASLVLVTSAGTFAEPGESMCPESGGVAGVDPEGHAARLLTADLLNGADLILTAESGHNSICARLSPACRPRLFTLRQGGALATAVARVLAAGDLPLGAPDPPLGARDRLRWFVGEMDAGRGIAVAGSDPALDDLPDTHGASRHEESLRKVESAARIMAIALAEAIPTGSVG